VCRRPSQITFSLPDHGDRFVCRRASATIAIKTNPGIKDSCANAFNGPLKLVRRMAAIPLSARRQERVGREDDIGQRS